VLLNPNFSAVLSGEVPFWLHLASSSCFLEPFFSPKRPSPAMDPGSLPWEEDFSPPVSSLTDVLAV